MNRHSLLSALLLLAAATQSVSAQIQCVNPTPQRVEGTQATPATQPRPEAWRIVCDKARSTSIALQTLQSDPRTIPADDKAKYKLTLGIKGDKAVKRYADLVPSRPEAYYLHIGEKETVIAAADERGLFYGVQTLLSSIAQGRIEYAKVTDWPDVPFRGTVEGFYGTPWSHEARLSQLAFYGHNKMNVYIYGPKDDPYHRFHWREPYPEAEARRIQELNECAKRNGVDFYWAIHPGLDIRWTEADRDALMSKLDKMYELGIRAFAVFFDDISGEGARADKQAELLNYVNEHFVKTHTDVAPLIMCPTEYNRSWVNEKGGYLRTLGSQLQKDVAIMWTGNSVVHCIDKESMEWVNERIQRKAYIWWNFPVNDFVRDHILLGPAYDNGLDIADDMAGFVSNPMEYAEASKISLYGIADYTWNMKAYDYRTNWEKALQYVMPEQKEALRTFALYNKDLGPNGHGFRREEGEELQPAAQKLEKGYDAEANRQVAEACTALRKSTETLLADTKSQLVKELRPWLLQGRNVADYGTAITQMGQLLNDGSCTGTADTAAFRKLHAQAVKLQKTMYDLENSDVLHPYQTGIKVGTKVLLPTLNHLFAQSVDSFNSRYGTQLTNATGYNPFTLTSDVAQLAQLPLTVRGTEIGITPSNEVIRWQDGGSLTISGDREITLAGMDFNLGTPGVAKNFKLEVYHSGAWHTVSLLHYSETDPVIHTGNELGGMKALRLRITNTSGKEQQVYFRSFRLMRQ